MIYEFHVRFKSNNIGIIIIYQQVECDNNNWRNIQSLINLSFAFECIQEWTMWCQLQTRRKIELTS